MEMTPEICEHGLDEYPASGVILGNLAMALWIGLGTAACWFVYPVTAWVYLAAALTMVFVVLRKLVCTNCYYYGRRCALGWGKLSALLFEQGSIDRFSSSAGVKLAPATYGLLTLIPLVLIIIALVQSVTAPRIVVLVLLLMVSFYSGALGRKKACARCKMRLICPGSAAK